MTVKHCIKSLGILALLRYLPILLAIYAEAFNFSVIVVVYVSLQASFLRPPYNLTETELGLLNLAPTIGYAISSFLGGRWLDYIMAHEARKAGRYGEDGKLKYLPEERMKENMWLSATLFPAMFIWYSWSTGKGLHWTSAAVAMFLCVLFGIILHGAVATAQTEFTPKRASSGIALNNFMHSMLSCMAVVVTQPIHDAMGIGWMVTMIDLSALVTILAALAALRIWGRNKE